MKTKVVVTRPSGPYSGMQRLSAKLRSNGFEPFELPVLSCSRVPLSAETRNLFQETLSSKAPVWLAFLSPTAVSVWRELVDEEPLAAQIGERALLAVQGNGTAEACPEFLSRAPDFIPSVFVAEEFAKDFAQIVSGGQRILVPQSAEGRDLLAPTLCQKGFAAQSFKLYQLEAKCPPEETIRGYHRLNDGDTVVVFMSPSAVRAAVELVGASLSSKKLVSVGPITSQAIRKAGLPVWREAEEHSEDGVLSVLLR